MAAGAQPAPVKTAVQFWTSLRVPLPQLKDKTTVVQIGANKCLKSFVTLL